MAFLPPVPAQVSAGNSSTTALGANAVFTGTAIDITTIATSQITATAISDKPSATNGFQIQYSVDNTNWFFSVESTVVANVAAVLINGSLAQFIRVVYTNGPTAQTTFSLQTLLSNLPPSLSNVTITSAPAALSTNNTTAPSLTTGQTASLQSDYEGSLFVKPYRRGQTVAQGTTCTTTTATTVLAAQAAGIFADIATLIITVTGAAAAAFTVTLSDGTNSYVFDVNTGTATTTGAMIFLNSSIPLPATTAATAWTLAMSVAHTVHVVVVAALQKAS